MAVLSLSRMLVSLRFLECIGKIKGLFSILCQGAVMGSERLVYNGALT